MLYLCYMQTEKQIKFIEDLKNAGFFFMRQHNNQKDGKKIWYEFRNHRFTVRLHVDRNDILIYDYYYNDDFDTPKVYFRGTCTDIETFKTIYNLVK